MSNYRKELPTEQYPYLIIMPCSPLEQGERPADHGWRIIDAPALPVSFADRVEFLRKLATENAPRVVWLQTATRGGHARVFVKLDTEIVNAPPPLSAHDNLTVSTFRPIPTEDKRWEYVGVVKTDPRQMAQQVADLCKVNREVWYEMTGAEKRSRLWIIRRR